MSGQGLIDAAKTGDVEAVKTALNDNADVNYQDAEWTWTALHWACCEGHENVVEYLCVEARCNPNVVDKHGKIALHVAAKNGALGCVKFLVNRGSDVNFQARHPADSWTPLMYAAKHGHAQVAQYLIDRGASTTRTTNDGSLAMDYAADDNLKTICTPHANKVPPSVDVLLSWAKADAEKGQALVTALNKLGVTASLAVRDDSDDAAAMAKWTTAARNALMVLYQLTSSYMDDPLCRAQVSFSDGVDLEAITLLLEDVPFPPPGPVGLAMAGKLYQYMLGDAYASGIATICGIVDKAKQSSNDTGSESYRHTPEMQGRCPPGLLQAVQDNDLDQVRDYIDKGYDMDQGDKQDLWTPLMWAAYYGKPDMVGLLCVQGHADANVIDRYGKQALHVACKNGNLDCVRFLCERGADPEYVASFPDNSWSPLCYAAKHGHPEVIKYLLGLGIEKGTPLRNGQIAYDMASDDTCKELLKSEIVYAVEAPKHYDVFLSYNWTHQPQVKEIRAHLEAAGLTVWMDISQMEAGDELFGAIDAGMRASSCVVMCVTKPYAASLNCRKEVALCNGLRKPFAPILLDPECSWPPEGPMAEILEGVSYIDFTQGIDAAAPLLVARASGLAGSVVHQSVPANRRVGVYDQDLKQAVVDGNLDRVVELVDAGADPDVWNPEDTWSPLHWAAYGGHTEIVGYLCTEGRASPNVQDKYGKTALHVACKNGHLNIVKFLVGRGADLNYIPSFPTDAWTPLIYAVAHNHPDIVQYLLTCGADVNYQCLDYTTAYDKAKGNDKIEGILTEAKEKAERARIASKGQKAIKVDVFLSHFANNRTLATKVKQSLTDSGLTVWMDDGELSGSQDVRDRIVDMAMRSCHVVVPICSNAYAANGVCIKEITLCDGLKKPAYSLRTDAAQDWPPAGVMSPILAAQDNAVIESTDIDGVCAPVVRKVQALGGGSKVSSALAAAAASAIGTTAQSTDTATDGEGEKEEGETSAADTLSVDKERVAKLFPGYKDDTEEGKAVTAEVEGYLKNFVSADEDKSQSIDMKEMRPLLEKCLDRKVKDKEVKQAFKEVDTDNSGLCDVYEYLAVLKNVKAGKKSVFSRACTVQ